MPHARRSTVLLCGEIHARGEGSDDDAIAVVASRQEGIVGRSQLLDLGIGERAIDNRLAVGRLRLQFPGVYAVGHEAIGFSGRALAAVLSVAPDAAASHWTAAVLWGIVDRRAGAIHVTAARYRSPRRGVVIHRARLPEEDLEIVDGMPVTNVARTLLDLSATEDEGALRRLIKQAEFLNLIDRSRLAAILARHPRRRGRRTLARIVEAHLIGANRTQSELEDRFLEFCSKHRLPMPETNVVLEVRGKRFKVDCVWRDAKLIVELDGYGAHGKETAFHLDRARDRVLIAEGWVPMRATWAQLHLDADGLAAEILDTLANRRGLLQQPRFACEL